MLSNEPYRLARLLLPFNFKKYCKLQSDAVMVVIGLFFGQSSGYCGEIQTVRPTYAGLSQPIFPLFHELSFVRECVCGEWHSLQAVQRCSLHHPYMAKPYHLHQSRISSWGPQSPSQPLLSLVCHSLSVLILSLFFLFCFVTDTNASITILLFGCQENFESCVSANGSFSFH